MGALEHRQLLANIRTRLEAVHGDRLRGVILYGSVARGDAGPESDVDVLVLLQGPVRYGRDLDLNSECLYPLARQLGRRISAKPVAADEYGQVDCPLYRRARAEGISG